MEKTNSNVFCVTWGNSQTLIPQDSTPPIDLTGNSLRQIVKISIGGKKFRIKLSNIYGNDILELKSISIAKSLGSGQIELDSIKTLNFENNASIQLEKGTEVYTDIFDYTLASGTEVAVSIYFGGVPQNLTGHIHSITNSFIAEGNAINEEKFPDEHKVAHWYFISSIEVISDNNNVKGLVCFGDSITDGRFSSLDRQERWPDFLFKKFADQKINIAVNNQGLSGTSLTTHGVGRFDRDVMGQNGVKYLIVFYGINDITKLNKSENEIIDEYKKIIEIAHKKNIIVLGATLTPFKGYRLYNEERNKIRIKINEWIRNFGKNKNGFDCVIDFDLIIRDRNDKDKIIEEFNSGDSAHLNSAGYKKLVEAFNDLSIFKN